MMSSNAGRQTLTPWPISNFQVPCHLLSEHKSDLYSNIDQLASVGNTKLFLSVCCTVFQSTFDLIAFLFDKYDFDPVMIALFAAIIFKKRCVSYGKIRQHFFPSDDNYTSWWAFWSIAFMITYRISWEKDKYKLLSSLVYYF